MVLDFPDDESAAIWYVTHSGQYNGQPVKKVYQNYSADLSIWTVVTANGETYESHWMQTGTVSPIWQARIRMKIFSIKGKTVVFKDGFLYNEN